MQTLADFPIDPELVTAVENALQWQTLALVPLPEEWLRAIHGKRKQINGKSIKAKRGRLKNRDGERCFYCHHRLRRNRAATIDHLVPNVLVRSWHLDNLVLACEPCNQAKGERVHAVLMPFLAVLVYNLARLNQGAERTAKAVA